MDHPLRDRPQWLLAPSALAALPIALATVAYAALRVELPAGSGGRFVGAVVVTAVLATLGLRLRLMAQLSTLGRVGRGELPSNRQNLQRVAQEVSALPDALFWANSVAWVLGAAVISGFAVWGIDGVTPAMGARISRSAVLFAPLGAVVSQVVATLRARELLTLLTSAGLSIPDLLEALPPKRQEIRGRLMVFVAVLALSPAAIAVDVSVDALQYGLTNPSAVHHAFATLAGMGALMFAFVLATAWLAGLLLGQPMRSLAAGASRLTHGDLRSVVLVPAEDELWAVSTAFTMMQRQMIEILAELKRAAVQIAAATEQMLAMTVKSQSGANEQAAAVQETSATSEELARVATEIAGSASNVARIAEQTLAAASSGQSTSRSFVESMTKMKADSRAISERVGTLSQRVQQIGRIVEFINGVADKSDLLALNAELEGTKAGEVGLGFSLVAAEMRRLAENVIKSTREIEELIGEVREATGAAVQVSEAGARATDDGAQLARRLTQNLEVVFGLAQRNAESVRAISTATAMQRGHSGQLVDAMTNVQRVNELSMESSRQLQTSSSELATLAREMRAVVESFQIETKPVPPR